MTFIEEIAKDAKLIKIEDQLLVLIKRHVETELMLEEKFQDLCEDVSNFVKESEDMVKKVERLSYKDVAKKTVHLLRRGQNRDLYKMTHIQMMVNESYLSVCEKHTFCMTRSSTNELFKPYKEPAREFRSSRKHFKTLSLDELRSPDFNLLSDQEYSKEEEVEAIAETMEQYMSKTRTDYGSRVAKTKIDNKDQFELKGQFLKELRENTFSGSDNEDANEHIEKVLKIIDLFHVPNITEDQLMLRVFPISLTGAASRWLRNKPTEPDETLYQAWERFKELLKKCPQHYLTEMSETVEDAKKAIQEMAEYSQKWHNGTSRGRSTKTSDGLAAIQAQLNNLGREIKKVNEKVYAAQVGCEQCKGPHYTKDFPLKEEGKTLEESYYMQFGGPFQGRGYRATALGYYQRNNANPAYQERSATTDAAIRNQGASIKTLEIQIGKMSKNSKLLYKSRQTTIPFPSRLDNHYCEEEEGNYEPKFTKAYGASHINNTIPRKEKDPRSFTLPCFISNTCFDNALVDLGVSDSEISKGIAENVLVGIGKFNFPVDFIILDMPEDIKVHLILGRPFLSTARAKIDVYKRKITLRVREENIIFKSVKPVSSLIKRVYMLSLRERMELDLEARRMGETLVNQGDDLMPTIEEGGVIEEFRNRDEDLDTGIDDYPSYCDSDKKIHIGALMNVPIFVGTFSVVTDFAVLEDMNAYRDEGMGDVIVGEPFLREVGIKAKRFDGMITIYNGNDELEICTLQMGTYISSQNSCDFTTVTINGESEEQRANEGIIRNYYDREDCKTTPRFKVLVLYKVEDIATCLVENAKFWDDWEVDHYGSANLDLSRLGLNDMEGMYFLKVQGKPHHRKLEFEIDFINALLLYIRRVVIKNRIKDIR
ncbi:hypothetical protein Tco_1523811 [Tanacetum coccineum]